MRLITSIWLFIIILSANQAVAAQYRNSFISIIRMRKRKQDFTDLNRGVYVGVRQAALSFAETADLLEFHAQQ